MANDISVRHFKPMVRGLQVTCESRMNTYTIKQLFHDRTGTVQLSTHVQRGPL